MHLLKFCPISVPQNKTIALQLVALKVLVIIHDVPAFACMIGILSASALTAQCHRVSILFAYSSTAAILANINS